MVEGPSSGMLLAGAEAVALVDREVRGLAAVDAPLAEEPATLPGIVVVDGCFTCVDKKETKAES